MKRTREHQGHDEDGDKMEMLLREMEILKHEVKIIRLKLEKIEEKRPHPIPKETSYNMPPAAYQGRSEHQQPGDFQG